MNESGKKKKKENGIPLQTLQKIFSNTNISLLTISKYNCG